MNPVVASNSGDYRYVSSSDGQNVSNRGHFFGAERLCRLPHILIIAEELRDVLAEWLPGEVLDDLSEALNRRLAKWSKSAEIPLIRYRQQLDHVVVRDERHYLCRVFFKYGQDEQSLRISDIQWI